MSEYVSFENNNEVKGYNRFEQKRSIPLLSRFLINIGLAKSETQAEKILIIIAVCIIVVSIFLIIWSYQPSPIKTINIVS